MDVGDSEERCKESALCLDVLMRILKVLSPIRTCSGNVRHDPLLLVVLHLGTLLVSWMLVAENPPPIVQLLEVTGIASKLEDILVAEGANLAEHVGLRLAREGDDLLAYHG